MNCRVCGSELPAGAMFCGECGSSVTATRVRRPAVEDPRPSDTTIIEPLPAAAVRGRSSGVHSVPVPQAPFTPEPPAVASTVPDAEVTFVLHVSTGERAVVVGSGLLGRRPIAQPGEHPDQLISIADTGRSVSKTHLEFGMTAAEFWICDRYSANGTTILPRNARPRRCEPGRRYRAPHGSRIEIGDQWIDVE